MSVNTEAMEHALSRMGIGSDPVVQVIGEPSRHYRSAGISSLEAEAFGVIVPILQNTYGFGGVEYVTH